MIDYYEPQIDLTLLGCGFLGKYQIGAVYLLSQIWPQKPYNKICGASCGGLLAALLVSGFRFDQILAIAMKFVRTFKSKLTEPNKQLGTMRQMIFETLNELLPDNSHKLCSGRIGISLTKLWSFENKFVWQFETRQDLIDALVAGCFIPLWSGSIKSFPKFKGDCFIDGAYSDNLPKFKLTQEERQSGARQLHVSPYSCLKDNVEVCPNDKWHLGAWKVMGTRYHISWGNFLRALYSMNIILDCQYNSFLIEGHKDMKEYILNSNLIKCYKCFQTYGLTSASGLEETKQNHHHIDNQDEKDPTIKSCLSCLILLEKVDNLKIPPELLKIIE